MQLAIIEMDCIGVVTRCYERRDTRYEITDQSMVLSLLAACCHLADYCNTGPTVSLSLHCTNPAVWHCKSTSPGYLGSVPAYSGPLNLRLLEDHLLLLKKYFTSNLRIKTNHKSSLNDAIMKVGPGDSFTLVRGRDDQGNEPSVAGSLRHHQGRPRHVDSG